MFLLIKNICIVLVGSWFMMHPVHVSVTNMDYNAEDVSIESSTKIFKKDFKLLIYHLYAIEVDFETDTISEKNRKLMEDYFLSHFKVKLDNSVSPELTIKNIQIKDEYVWFYCHIDVDEHFNQVEIFNGLLFDLYFDQKNMLIFGYNQSEKGYLFNIQQTNHTINLDEF